MTPDRRKKGGRPPSGEFLGACQEHNSLVHMMLDWMHEADRSRASVFEALTTAHFEDEMPGRTAMYRMLRGHNLTWEFIDAVADICTDTHEHHGGLLDAARPIWEKSVANPTPISNPVDQTQQRLVDALTELTETQKELLSVRQIREVSDQALIKANQMVTMLLLMIGQLESQIVSLKHNLNSLSERKSDIISRDNLKDSITVAEDQRNVAETELQRAKRERDEAFKVSTEATISARALQDDAQLLRVVNNLGRDENLEKPLPALPTLQGVSGKSASEDFSETLKKIKVELDYGEEEIEEVRRKLHGENVPREVDESIIIGEVVAPVPPPAKEFEQQEAAFPGPRNHNSPGTHDPGIKNSRAEAVGYGPSQVLRISDVLRREDSSDALRTVFRSAAALQTNAERFATSALLVRLRDGQRLKELWEDECSSAAEIKLDLPPEPQRHYYPQIDMAGKIVSVKPLSRRNEFGNLAQVLGLRIEQHHRPRFAVMERRGEGESLLAVVKSDELSEIKDIVARVLGRLDGPPLVYVVDVRDFPQGDTLNAIYKIPLWHEGGSALLSSN